MYLFVIIFYKFGLCVLELSYNVQFLSIDCSQSGGKSEYRRTLMSEKRYTKSIVECFRAGSLVKNCGES